MTVTAETILKKTGEQTAGNVCLYGADGKPVVLTAGGELPVSIANLPAIQPVTDQPNTTPIVEGTLGQLNDAIALSAAGFQTLFMELYGSVPNMSVVIESSSDNSTWTDRTMSSTTLTGLSFTTTPIAYTGVAQSGAVAINTYGIKYWRVRCSVYTSGSLSVRITPIVAGFPTKILVGGNTNHVTTDLYAWTGSTWGGLYGATANTDGNSATTILGLWANNRLYGYNGTSWDRLRSSTSFGLQVDTTRQATYYGKTITYFNVSQGAAGTTVLATADATKKNKLMGFTIALDANGTIQFTDGTVSTGAIPVLASQPLNVSCNMIPFWETAAVNRALSLTTVGGKAFGVAQILVEA